MKLSIHMLTALLSAALPLTAGANGKAKRAAVVNGVQVTPQKPVPSIWLFTSSTQTSRTLVATKPTKPTKAKKAKKAGATTTKHLLRIDDSRPDEHIRDDLSFFEVRRDGVVWDAATQGKPTPQRVRQAMRGKGIAAGLVDEKLTASKDSSEVHRDRKYAMDGALAARQPVVVRRDIRDGGPSHDRVVVIEDLGILNFGEFHDGADVARVDANSVSFVPYANQSVIGATPAFKPYDAKTRTYGKTTIRMRGGINALPPGADYTIINRRTDAEVARGEAHAETGSFRADLELDDHKADDVYDLVISTGSSDITSYEFRAPAAKATEARGDGALALQSVRLRANGTTAARPEFAKAEEDTLYEFGKYLRSSHIDLAVAKSVRDGLGAYKAGKATPFERIELLSAIVARVKGLNYGEARKFRLVDVVIGKETVTLKLESRYDQKQLTTQVYTLAD